MDYNTALKYIHSFEKFGWQLGLDRIKALLEKLDNPQDKLKFVHIAGTNGKGSTTTMCADILKNAGYKCGSYTSPFVIDFRERFKINGNMISKDDFAKYAEIVKEKIDELKAQNIHITEFEAITAIAFLYFYSEKCDIVCLEVGLGGKFDATNVIKEPLVSIITSISKDHINILGDTIEKIASEKAGIIKKNSDCICYCKQDIDAMAVIMEECANKNAKFIKPNDNNIKIIKINILGNEFIYNDKTYKTALVGEHQIYNAVSVIECMKLLNQKGFNISDDCIKNSIENTVFNARFEVLSQKPYIVIDGAHNLEGTTALAKTIKNIDVSINKKYAIMGMLSDKDYKKSVNEILSVVDKMVCVPVENERGLDPKIIFEEFKSEKISYTYSINNILKEILSYIKEDDFLIICGSLYMVGTARDIVKNILK